MTTTETATVTIAGLARTRPGVLPPTAQRLYRLLAALPLDARARVTNGWLAARLEVSRRAVTAALTDLVDAGVVEVATRRGHPSLDPVARTLRLPVIDGDDAADLDTADLEPAAGVLA